MALVRGQKQSRGGLQRDAPGGSLYPDPLLQGQPRFTQPRRLPRQKMPQSLYSDAQRRPDFFQAEQTQLLFLHQMRQINLSPAAVQHHVLQHQTLINEPLTFYYNLRKVSLPRAPRRV